MSKAIFTADQLETLLSRVLGTVMEKFDSCMDKIVDKFEARLEKLHGDLSMANCRIDKLEQELNSTGRNFNQPIQQARGSVEQATIKSLTALKEEKAEREKRSRNDIITGLHPKAGMHDADTFAEFCENYLTIKPVPVRGSCHRLGRATNGGPARLKLTFDTSQAVH